MDAMLGRNTLSSRSSMYSPLPCPELPIARISLGLMPDVSITSRIASAVVCQTVSMLRSV